jgi:hypothetical protein
MNEQETAIVDSDSGTGNDVSGFNADGDWLPGQDVQVDHAKILDILVTFLNGSSGETTDKSSSSMLLPSHYFLLS